MLSLNNLSKIYRTDEVETPLPRRDRRSEVHVQLLDDRFAV